ncbi:copper homeostasis protein CutC [Bailinhaonella thermotolerans]|uniref:Copper homeostasis protein cutC homolog n=1 Tax=Bailinhaonella thermotolerans TaxID=1070861 RepID=A0A3A4AD49_9ACTN|nr:copper homeostasis protein CutC [Bailinhaonella thermotolerans]RJL26595.1 copper homeostasis protein CutC [Bailinhaonella thermotolerans]
MDHVLFEVIALDARDAAAAQAGGADRLEVVSDMSAGGLTPSVATVKAIKAECSLPLRVMLRSNAGFTASSDELSALSDQAGELRAAGADAFVFGFLDDAGMVDVSATLALAQAVAPLPWTFHRAVDNASRPEAAWRVVREFPGLDTVLTSGSPRGVADGLDVLRSRAADAGLILAGGGLSRDHVAPLKSYGVRAFHVGSPVRSSWSAPVDEALVREWRDLLDTA